MPQLSPSSFEKIVVKVAYDLPHPEGQPSWRLKFNVGAVNAVSAGAIGALAGVAIHNIAFPEHEEYEQVNSRQELLEQRLEKLQERSPSVAVSKKAINTQLDLITASEQMPAGYNHTADMVASYGGGLLVAAAVGAALYSKYPYVQQAYRRVYGAQS